MIPRPEMTLLPLYSQNDTTGLALTHQVLF